MNRVVANEEHGMQQKNRWLLEYAANRTSQCGEDGIIAKILDTVGDPSGWSVEFGAWDGRHYSNSYDLIANRDYSAVMIEGDPVRFRALVATFADNPRVIPLNAFVGFTADNALDVLLADTPVPREFDLLSIDIDGNDYHVWNAVERYRPRLVCIEYNPTIPSVVDFVQPADMRVNQGASLAALGRLAEDKGYKLVCVTDLNGLFVDAQYYDRFAISDNSVHALRPNEDKVTWVFNGYDGTVFVRGHCELGWHGMPYDEQRMQMLPGPLRQYPKNYGPIKKVLARWYRSLRKRRLL